MAKCSKCKKKEAGKYLLCEECYETIKVEKSKIK